MAIFLSLAITLGLLILLASLLPLVNWAAYPEMYRPLLQARLNRTIHCRTLRISLIPRVRLRMEGVTIDEDPSFGEVPFITLSGLDYETSWWSIIGRRPEGMRLVLQDPSIAIVSSAEQGMNLDTWAQVPNKAFAENTFSADKPPRSTSLCALLGVKELVISRGVVTYEHMTKNTRELRRRFTHVQGHLGRPRKDQSARMSLSAVADRKTWAVTGSFHTRGATCALERLEISCLQGQTSGRLTGTLSPSFDLTLDAQNLDARDLNVLPDDGPGVRAADVKAHMWTQAPQHHLFQMSARAFQGRLSIEGRFVEHQRLLLDLNAEFQDIRFEELFELVQSKELRITGKARLSLHLFDRQPSVATCSASFEGSGHLHITDGTLGGVTLLEEAAAVLDTGDGPWWPMRFSSLEAEFTIGADAIRITTLHITGKGLRSTSAGEIHFDRSVRLQTDLRLSESLSRTLARTMRVLEHGVQHGWLSLPLILTGTLDRPVVRLDKEVLGERARDQIRDQVIRWWMKGERPPQSDQQSWTKTLRQIFRRSSDEGSGESE